MRAALVVLVVLGALGGPVGAGESPDLFAGRVRSAFEAGDKDALRALAARPEADPWVVADLLCTAGAHDAAATFAAAVKGPGVADLPV